MITKIKVTNEALVDDKTLEIRLSDPLYSGVALTSITGLDPGQATVNTIELASADGAFFGSARRTSRNIVLGLVVMDRWPTVRKNYGNNFSSMYTSAIEYNRHVLYRYFPLKGLVTMELEFTNQNMTRSLKIDGYVETFSASIFSPMQACQVSLICPDPYFLDAINKTTVDGTFSSIVPLFEFSKTDVEGNEGLWSNEIQIVDGEEKVDNIEFGYFEDNPEAVINYIGEVETGYVITYFLGGPCGNITYTEVKRSTFLAIDTSKIEEIVGSSLEAGDKITIDTRIGKKSIILTRAGVNYNALNSLMAGSTWPVLSPGANVIRFDVSKNASNVTVEVACDILYGGV